MTDRPSPAAPPAGRFATAVATFAGNAYLLLGSLIFGLLTLLVSWMPPRGPLAFVMARLWARCMLAASAVRDRGRVRSGARPAGELRLPRQPPEPLRHPGGPHHLAARGAAWWPSAACSRSRSSAGRCWRRASSRSTARTGAAPSRPSSPRSSRLRRGTSIAAVPRGHPFTHRPGAAVPARRLPARHEVRPADRAGRHPRHPGRAAAGQPGDPPRPHRGALRRAASRSPTTASGARGS